MYSPIMHNAKNRKLLSDLDKIIVMYPHMTTIPVSFQHFNILLDSIPIYMRNDYKDSIPYKGKVVVNNSIKK